MTASLAGHEARIKILEKGQETIDQKLDRLQNWIMTTLGAAILALVGIIGSLLKH